jgi:hypothetical protein
MLHALPTACTLLRRRRWVDRLHSLAGACCRVGEDGEQLSPPGVLHARVETGFSCGPVVRIGAVLILLGRATAAQGGRLDRLAVEHVVGS